MTSARRAIVTLLAAILISSSLVAFPSPASAHTLTKAKATKKVRSVARQLADELTGVAQWEAGACLRLSQHAFRCTYFLRFDDGSLCGQRLRIFYRSHGTKRLSVAPFNEFGCGL